jgi:cyclopropane-fatty-acyl-phospholipid synthase
LIYSAALFEDPSWQLDQAQQARLKRICEDLDLRADQRFLDVGCGWGGLLVYAADSRRARATGCTLSHNQYEFANSLIHARGLEQRASVQELDYRDLWLRFDKIASIGMFEHVGRWRLGQYFRKIYSLLERGGMFLNSGIVRPENVTDNSQTWFLLRRVFPGGELAHLSEIVRAAEGAGFGIVRIESLRKHYARTCQEWVRRLCQNMDKCVGLVGEQTYRTWLLYLAASAVNFEAGTTDVFSILMEKA